MIGYKLVRKLKSGEIAPLFINAKLRIEPDKWYDAEDHPTKGFAHRPGWHVLLRPYAPHLSTNGREWWTVEYEDYEIHERPQSQGGKWALAKRCKFIEPTDQRLVDEWAEGPKQEVER